MTRNEIAADLEQCSIADFVDQYNREKDESTAIKETRDFVKMIYHYTREELIGMAWELTGNTTVEQLRGYSNRDLRFILINEIDGNTA